MILLPRRDSVSFRRVKIAAITVNSTPKVRVRARFMLMKVSDMNLKND